MAGRSGREPEGSAKLLLPSSVTQLDPEEAVWRAMVRWVGVAAGRPAAGPWGRSMARRWCGRFMTFTGSTRGGGSPSMSRSGRRRCAPAARGRTRRCGATRTRSPCSATTWSIRATGGGRSASAGSVPIRCRSVTSGTPPGTSASSKPTRGCVRSPAKSCSVLRLLRRPVDRARRPGPQGLAGRLPGRDPVQGRLRVRVASPRGGHAGRARFPPQRQGPRVRPLRPVHHPVRQGGEGLPAAPTLGAVGVRLDHRRARRVRRRRAALLPAGPADHVVADRTRRPLVGRLCEHPVP